MPQTEVRGPPAALGSVGDAQSGNTSFPTARGGPSFPAATMPRRPQPHTGLEHCWKRSHLELGKETGAPAAAGQMEMGVGLRWGLP